MYTVNILFHAKLFHLNGRNEFIWFVLISQVQHDKREIVLEKFPEGIDTMTPLNEFSDIQSEAELKFNKNKSLKLLNPNEESSKNVNSITEKK